MGFSRVFSLGGVVFSHGCSFSLFLRPIFVNCLNLGRMWAVKSQRKKKKEACFWGLLFEVGVWCVCVVK